MENEIQQILNQNKKIAIYGAGIVAYNIAEALQSLYGVRIESFFVSEMYASKKQFSDIESVPMSIETFKEYGEPFIFVATPEQYHIEIQMKLRECGVRRWKLVDSKLQYQIMSTYFKTFFAMKDMDNLIDDLSVHDKKVVEIYMAKSVFDKKISKKYTISSAVIPVHAGAAVTKKRLAYYTDDFEKGISARNRNYCELTVSYWAWKNRKAHYKGICHYRRTFVLSDNDIDKCVNNGVDIIIPLPFICKYNISEQYLRYISKEDISILRKVLNKLYSQDMKKMDEIFSGRIIYNYNMLIAKNEIFDEYCKFIFSVLFEIEDYYINAGIIREDRYLGYLGEVLTTIFIIMNSKNYNIVHVNKQWMI